MLQVLKRAGLCTHFFLVKRHEADFISDCIQYNIVSLVSSLDPKPTRLVARCHAVERAGSRPCSTSIPVPTRGMKATVTVRVASKTIKHLLQPHHLLQRKRQNNPRQPSTTIEVRHCSQTEIEEPS